MIIAVFGAAGSMGRRHIRNLTALDPEVQIIAVDPLLEPVEWRNYPTVDAAIIASPYAQHLETMTDLCYWRVPFYVEKPPVSRGQSALLADLVDFVEEADLRCAVGFQYRWHPALAIKLWRSSRFLAQDDLLERYGPTCLETMVSHPIDTALYSFGAAQHVELQSDGITTYGIIEHGNGKVSEFELYMNRSPRLSMVSNRQEAINLYANDEMYVDALRGWLAWLATGQRDTRTATLADGLAVMRVMEQVKEIK